VKLLADENFPRAAIEALRSLGHEVLAVAENSPGSPDEKILESVNTDGRVLITFDKDFGELAFRSNLTAPCGVILFRMTARSPEFIAQRTTEVIQSRDDWPGHLAVVEDTRVRLRSLPK